MKFKKSESGRSMVEMLGVLAIIGVLSVGGIAGYSLSMRRHRANQVLDLLSKYALITYNQCQQKIMNNEVTGTSSSGITSYDTCGVIAFSTANDIGTLPVGIEYIGYPNFITDEKSGIDIVTVSANFDDDKLCKAVASVAGVECDASKAVYIRIKQN